MLAHRREKEGNKSTINGPCPDTQFPTVSFLLRKQNIRTREVVLKSLHALVRATKAGANGINVLLGLGKKEMR